jgi:hypothetical protein
MTTGRRCGIYSQLRRDGFAIAFDGLLLLLEFEKSDIQ